MVVLAEQLEMPIQSVYVAKSRTAERLQRLVSEIEADFDEVWREVNEK